ncbi:ornithine decarboxylase 1-like [Phlebotomus argentipes]|uniref:ornithine decarboxylase 1-like n=1 Tax=Phlebotomus argentipes TaxID=94469 RepID=UPI00289301CF|nr:ornithine decarboxylase 1-like [Phlebotomus argentipes]
MKLQINTEVVPFEGHLDEEAVFRQKIYEEMDAGQDEALYLCNLSDVARKLDVWREKMPRIKPYYAVKCNSDENVVRLLAKLGTGFDCASRAEINAVLKHGVTPDRIIFANPCKAITHIRHAAATNTSLMTFDTTVELEKIHSIYPSAQLVLRIRCDAKKAQCPLGEKFGADPKLEAPLLLANAKNLGLAVVGISFHVGSGCQDPPVFRKAIAAARELFDYALTLGYRLHLLDIGGGFPGDTGTDIGVIADVVNAALDDYFPAQEGLEIIAEPGRFFVSSAYTLAVTVHSKNERLGPDGTVAHVKYFVNEGVYGSFNCVLYDHQVVTPHVLTRTAGEVETRPDVKCTIWGPSCDGFDKICDNMVLPLLGIGDVLVFPNMGAYTLTIATTFNGFPNPRVMYFADRDIWDLVEPLAI